MSAARYLNNVTVSVACISIIVFCAALLIASNDLLAAIVGDAFPTPPLTRWGAYAALFSALAFAAATLLSRRLQTVHGKAVKEQEEDGR